MTLLIIIIVLALIFDFINGFHDAANSIATIVSTKVLTPVQAVIWAAFFNVMAFWIFELHVADTIAKTVKTDAISLEVIFAGLCAAIIWNLITWWMGIPSSSSHTLIGGFAGAAISHAGFGVVKMDVVLPILLFIVAAPVIGMLVSYIISVIMLWLSRKGNPYKLNNTFKGLQLLSSALFSLGHGGNDAQKVMGIIAAALVVYANQHPDSVPQWMEVIRVGGKIKHIPSWVVMGCYSAIGFGTLFGGWKIVKTMGTKITKMSPFEGVAAETAGAITLFTTAELGIPVSTTHTITGSIIGVGLTKRISAVRWGVTINLLWAWLLTIPISGLFAAGFYWLLKVFSIVAN
ncbi:inorganic phosphate transporter [Solitalea canadensis]|uniref:Phosphate/sulfate permease n=1 Tax=Solitalea canadensis (strain ATCC 29591 / DSM 3403 / JCM 21819 / LMG 8368 / NBRC 15130 / NCIMB 12057 / USAM 9D) TaxID=929556 RepID=H8KRZ1_SOLCM|nr:inorganic phosphate transporter [Solitalea canadensis]AFD07779.1 phosphate/sulfate permease [Solitalea canadensis DSM 3403]